MDGQATDNKLNGCTFVNYSGLRVGQHLRADRTVHGEVIDYRIVVDEQRVGGFELERFVIGWGRTIILSGDMIEKRV